MSHLYLDYNATTPLAPSVQQVMAPFLAEHYGNPSSDHALGEHCQAAVAEAREQVAALLGARAAEIVFTSGGTESNNLALKGVMCRKSPSGSGHLIISSLEHPAIVAPANYLARCGCEVSVVDCDARGVVAAGQVEQLIRPETKLVSLIHANNEIGTIQPIAEIAEICRARGVLLHTDAAQSVGKIATRVDELGVDLLTIAGHKLYAPKGVGVLYIRSGLELEPFMHGASHELGRRAGTENVPYLVGLGQAANLATHDLVEVQSRLEKLRDLLWEQLATGIGSGLTFNGADAPRLPNTLSVNFPDVIGSELLARVPQLCASTGAACHSGETTVSSTLAAIGLPAEIARGTVRLSLGRTTSEQDVKQAAQLLIAAWQELR
jgi:cysteine desulfurase